MQASYSLGLDIISAGCKEWRHQQRTINYVRFTDSQIPEIVGLGKRILQLLLTHELFLLHKVRPLRMIIAAAFGWEGQTNNYDDRGLEATSQAARPGSELAAGETCEYLKKCWAQAVPATGNLCLSADIYRVLLDSWTHFWPSTHKYLSIVWETLYISATPEVWAMKSLWYEEIRCREKKVVVVVVMKQLGAKGERCDFSVRTCMLGGDRRP